jgi:hypothetical protein
MLAELLAWSIAQAFVSAAGEVMRLPAYKKEAQSKTSPSERYIDFS